MYGRYDSGPGDHGPVDHRTSYPETWWTRVQMFLLSCLFGLILILVFAFIFAVIAAALALVFFIIYYIIVGIGLVLSWLFGLIALIF